MACRTSTLGYPWLLCGVNCVIYPGGDRVNNHLLREDRWLYSDTLLQSTIDHWWNSNFVNRYSQHLSVLSLVRWSELRNSFRYGWHLGKEYLKAYALWLFNPLCLSTSSSIGRAVLDPFPPHAALTALHFPFTFVAACNELQAGTIWIKYTSCRKIKLIEGIAKCRHLNNWPLKGLCGKFFLSEAQIPLDDDILFW